MTYRTYELALRRAGQLGHQGIWPGIIHLAGGGYALTYDPGDDERQP